MDFVWFYRYDCSGWRKFGVFNELEYSIKSVKQNVKDARCFVVGDEPPIDDDSVIWIPGPPRIDVGSPGEKAHQDTLQKFVEIANHPDIGDEFVTMWDDVFILKPTTVDDLKIAWAKAEITDLDEYINSPIRTGDRSYKKLWRSTYEFAKMICDSGSRKTYDWESHTPRYFEKEKLRVLLNKWDLKANPRLVTGMYACYHAENTQIITPEVQSDLWTHKPFMDFTKLLDVQYLNIYDDVIVPDFIDRMKELLD